jgi:hypothetical protein
MADQLNMQGCFNCKNFKPIEPLPKRPVIGLRFSGTCTYRQAGIANIVIHVEQSDLPVCEVGHFEAKL